MSQPESIKKQGSIEFVVPVLFTALMWIVFGVNEEFDLDLSKYGLYPRTLEGLRGIFTIPFLHGSLSHITNNTVSFLVLCWALFHFYRPIAWKTLLGIYLISGIWVWISARSNYHIGASGVVYGLAAFLFLSGWLRREKRVAALSLLVAFLYGGLWWGVLPVDPKISWEGHFWGALAGFSLAYLYRKQGPQKPQYNWDEDEEENEDTENHEAVGDNERRAFPNVDLSDGKKYSVIRYTVKKAEKKPDPKDSK
jgi:membrane associated rhomboid family serine protease